MLQFPHTSRGFQPAKDLFHRLALPLAYRITIVPRRAPIEGTLAPCVVLRRLRRHLHQSERRKGRALTVVAKAVGTNGVASKENL